MHLLHSVKRYCIYSHINRHTYKPTPIPAAEYLAKISDSHINLRPSHSQTRRQTVHPLVQHSHCTQSPSSSVRWVLCSSSTLQLAARMWLWLNDGIVQCELEWCQVTMADLTDMQLQQQQFSCGPTAHAPTHTQPSGLL